MSMVNKDVHIFRITTGLQVPKFEALASRTPRSITIIRYVGTSGLYFSLAWFIVKRRDV